MAEKKISLLALLKILEEYSDEKHILSEVDIHNLLLNKYDINIDRRTIYRNIKLLIEFGYDISTYKDNKMGYYLNERLLEKSQVFLLCNAIYSSKFIPESFSKEIIEKLLNTQSKYYCNEFKHNVYIENISKKENKEFFLNIEKIADAIKDKKTISFTYLKYDDDLKLVPKKEKPYILSPYFMVYENEKTYLIGKNQRFEDYTYFRVDKIKNIKEIDEEYQVPNNIVDPYEYIKNRHYMYDGEETNIKIKCDYKILDDIVDIFGKNIVIEKIDDNYFTTIVKSTVQGMIYISLQYLNYLEIVSPQEVREKIRLSLKEGINKYQ